MRCRRSRPSVKTLEKLLRWEMPVMILRFAWIRGVGTGAGVRVDDDEAS